MTLRPSYFCLPVVVLSLGGCHVFSNGEIGKTCEDTEDGCYGASTALSLNTLDPSYGHSSGGYTITLTGKGFKDDSTVTFGGNEATIISISDNTIEASVPPGDPGVADVAITTPAGSTSTLSNGFEYFQDAKGAVQFIAHVENYRGIEGVDSFSSGATGIGRWIEDSNISLWERYGAAPEDFEDDDFRGACTTLTPLVVDPRDESAFIEFSDMQFVGDGNALNLVHTGNGEYVLDAIEFSDFPLGQWLVLSEYSFNDGVTAEIENFAYSPAQVEDAVLVPHDFGQTLTGDLEVRLLSPTNDERNKVIIQAYVYSASDNSLLATVACIARDRGNERGGYFRVDADAWEYSGDWPEENYMVLYIGRMHTQEITLPHTNGIAAVSITNYQVIVGGVGPLEE